MRRDSLARVASWLTVGVVGLALAIEPPPKAHPKARLPTGTGRRLLSYNESTPQPVLRPSSMRVQWSGERDSQYVTSKRNSDVVLVDVASGNETVLLPAAKQLDGTQDFWIRHDQRVVLAATNATKLYRHSYSADYVLIDVETGRREALVRDQAGDVQYAVMAPAGSAVVFVRGNNVFSRDEHGTVHQVTFSGGRDMFHGVPDWVYEEEVLQDRAALWFSPDAEYVAFLSFNETRVGTFAIPHYMAGREAVPPSYPRELQLRYPKAGTANPTVQLSILHVRTRRLHEVPIDAFAAEDLIIGEVKWVTDRHAALIYRAFNRVQDRDKHVVVQPETLSSKTVRSRDSTDGWLENSLAISYVGSLAVSSSSSSSYYVDLSDESGWTHIYLYPLDGASKAVPLTSGEWEVDAILHVDTVRQLVYFRAAMHHSTERHIYRVSYAPGATRAMQPLVDDNVPAVWDASFSSRGGYYILSYHGPDVPYQELYAVVAGNSTTTTGWRLVRTMTSNAELSGKLDRYDLPSITYFELKHPDGYSLNVMQQLPPRFDPSVKYPVLFTPYGGPNSQTVIKAFQPYGWTAYVSSDPELQFAVYTVDNRGTGFKGRAFRSAVAKQLGRLEAEDQIWAARQLLARHAFLDPRKVAIWGWSYGGYLAAKVIERDSGVFTLGLSTAPTSDWRFYDSVYTERYMKTPTANPAGYEASAVRNVSGFRNVRGRFALMHGTADDNVHYQHAARLADLLVAGEVSPDKFRMMAFTDSDHGIRFHGAGTFIYKFLTGLLWDEVQRGEGEGGKMAQQWSRRRRGSEAAWDEGGGDDDVR
ncbi:hypothetical protein E4U41_004287 [Claviceps citrina]|nr:hypothetical protein E4U41_004287 [Claviceps citrina]